MFGVMRERFLDRFYDISKGIRQAFSFLSENGFAMSTRSVNAETDFWYKGAHTEVNVTSYWNKSYQTVEVILTMDGKRSNLLDMENLFGTKPLAELKAQIAGSRPRKKVESYAAFLRAHIDKLL